MGHKNNTRRARREHGVTLVEAAVGVILISIIVTIGVRLLSVEAEMMLLVEQQKFASEQLSGAVTSLAAAKLNLAASGHLADNASSIVKDTATQVVTLNQPLQTGYYDYVVRSNDSSDKPESWDPAVRGAVPSDKRVVLLRAWNVATVDAVRNLRRIQIAAFPPQALETDTPQAALSYREFNIGLGQ